MPATGIGESSSPPPPLIVIAYTNTSTILRRESYTIHAAEELAGNPNDPRRTRSQFESSISVKDPFFNDKCYIMVELDPQTYE